MSQVQIPFLYKFEQAMLTGRKMMTCRTKKYGDAGDWFEAFGAEFQIEAVLKVPLEYGAEHFLLEGCQSREEFIVVWRKLHPSGYDPKKVVFAHRFRLKTGDSRQGKVLVSASVGKIPNSPVEQGREVARGQSAAEKPLAKTPASSPQYSTCKNCGEPITKLDDGWSHVADSYSRLCGFYAEPEE